MTKQAQLGLFTIVALAAVFAIGFVVANVGARLNGYEIAVHFRTVAGLRTASTVYESGVPIGSVVKIALQPDYTVSVIVSVKNGVEIPRDARFLIETPFTGEPQLVIHPPAGARTDAAGDNLPHRVQALAEQPRGETPVTLTDLVASGTGQLQRLDRILGAFESREPRLLANLDGALDDARRLTSESRSSIERVTGRIDALTTHLSSSLDVATKNVDEITGELANTTRRNSGRVDALLVSFSASSLSLQQSLDALRVIATDPSLRPNVLSATRDLASSAHTLAALAGDLRTVTGDPRTQRQLRETIENIDGTTRRANRLLGQFGGGRSERGEPGAREAASDPTGALGVPGGPEPATASRPGAQLRPDAPRRGEEGAVGAVRRRFAAVARNLVLTQIRISQLAAYRSADATRRGSPLLGPDRGLRSDFNVVFLPYARQSLMVGANDIGGPSATANVLLLSNGANVRYGGGVLYSRLGVLGQARIAPRLALEARLYDLRHPTLDTYLNYAVTRRAAVFAGVRDDLYIDRRAVAGLQLAF